MSTPLDNYPKVRKALYTAQWVISGAMLLLGVAFAAIPDYGVPQWYTIALAVLSALWAYTGLTASANTPTTDDLPDDAPGDQDALGEDVPWTDVDPDDSDTTPDEQIFPAEPRQ